MRLQEKEINNGVVKTNERRHEPQIVNASFNLKSFCLVLVGYFNSYH